MTMLNITEGHPAGLYVGAELKGIGKLEIPNDDAWQALTDLARILGVTIIDREQQKTLEGCLEEVAADDNDYDLAATAWGVWQDRCEDLARALGDVLHSGDDS